jgi:hypothetical protein
VAACASIVAVADDLAGPERKQLVDRLVSEFDLRGLAATACERNGVSGREEAVAYCVVVLTRKADRPRTSSETGEAKLTYDLDPDKAGFRGRLAEWADNVARHLAQWEEVYTRIQDEADAFDIATLRGMIRTDRGTSVDDLIDNFAQHIAEVLAGAPRIEQMTLERVVEDEPARNEYAFHSPLDQWVRTIAGRLFGRFVASLEAQGSALEGGDVHDESEARHDDALRAFRELIEMVAELAETRTLLADVLEHAERLETALAAPRPTSREAASALAIVRAHLAYVVDDLMTERRAHRGMLAYLALAMRTSPQLQCVAILSLRTALIEQAVIDAFAETMHSILQDEHEPKPVLVAATRRAADADRIPRARAHALERISTAQVDRAAEVAVVVGRLTGLPPTVPDIRAIGPFVGSTYGVVKQQRSVALKELTAVDKLFGRGFGRYAMRINLDER